MKTCLAAGRLSFAIPSITLGSGNIAGANRDVYFWIKAKNRVGYNQPSAVRTLTVPNSASITISAGNFSQAVWEDYKEFIVCASLTNDFNTSRVIYKYSVENIAAPITISDTFVLFGAYSFPTAASLPASNIPNGYRVSVTSLNSVYEFVLGDSTTPDELTVLSATGGRWKLVSSNSLTETSVTARKELIEINETEYDNVDLSAITSVPSIKYWIINDSGNPLNEAELDLNEYFSSTTIYSTFNVQILGYINLTTLVLDTTGISFVNSLIEYPETRPSLSKPLPAGSAMVLEVSPNISLGSFIQAGSSISIYPILSIYKVVETPEYWDEPVPTLAALTALAPIEYRDGQTRLVISANKQYRFESASTAIANGDSILIPDTLPIAGRWIANSVIIPNSSITSDKLASDVLSLIDDGLNITTITIPTPTTYSINLDTVTFDYFVFQCPVSAGGAPTTFNISKTLGNNTGAAVILELRQSTSPVLFDSSILFPGGSLPVLSGANKTDLVVLKLVKDASGIVKKRGFIAQRDIG